MQNAAVQPLTHLAATRNFDNILGNAPCLHRAGTVPVTSFACVCCPGHQSCCAIISHSWLSLVQHDMSRTHDHVVLLVSHQRKDAYDMRLFLLVDDVTSLLAHADSNRAGAVSENASQYQ